MLKAVMSTPRNGCWEVIFQTQDDEGHADMSAIQICLPVQSYEHCQAVAHIFNNPPKESQP
jgi:hypothetical protein